MMIDIDGFRELNRRTARAVGDETLKSVARALTRRLRETDLIGRLGGDEFAVLLPHADEEGLAVVAEGLARVIPACSIDAGEGLPPDRSIGFTLIHQRSPSSSRPSSRPSARCSAPSSAPDPPSGSRRAPESPPEGQYALMSPTSVSP